MNGVKKYFLFLLVLLAIIIISQLENIFPQAHASGGPSYTTKSNTFSIDIDSTWTDYDLFTNQGVPKGAVAEIVIRNMNVDNERYGGVREYESSIDRRIQLHEAEGNGYTTATMLVQTDFTTGYIEVYAEVISDISFVLIGYFEGYDFTEAFLPILGADTWGDMNLSSQGVPANAVCQILMRNPADGDTYDCGVRANGSSLDRKVTLDEAEGGGENMLAMLVKADADSIIETIGIPSTSGTFGDRYIGSFGYDSDGADIKWGTNFQLTIPMMVTHIHVHCGATPTSNFRAGIYNAPSLTGNPTSLVAQSEAKEVSGAKSWRSFQLPSPIQLPAGYYWLGVIVDNGMEMSFEQVTDRGKRNSDTYSDGFADPFGTPISEARRWSIYAESEGGLVGYLLGWFSSNVDFTEGWTEYSPAVDEIWESKTITEADASSIVAFALVHEDSGKETYCGLRVEGGAQERKIWEHEAEGGGNSGFQACVTLDADKKCEVYCEDASEAHFYYTGHFTIAPFKPNIPSLVLNYFNTTLADELCGVYAEFFDTEGLSGYIFWNNATSPPGGVNSSWTSLTGTSDSLLENITLPSSGTKMGVKYYVNDTDGNWGALTLIIFPTAQTGVPPVDDFSIIFLAIGIIMTLSIYFLTHRTR